MYEILKLRSFFQLMKSISWYQVIIISCFLFTIRFLLVCWKRAKQNQQLWEPPQEECHKLKTRDGLNINARIIRPPNTTKVCLVALPLGQHGFSSIYPLFPTFGDDYILVSWDYRGMFQSDCPKIHHRISIHEHAQDSMEVLNYFSFKATDIMLGHSLGVSVVLEAAILYPQRIKSLILLNGAHGHVFKYTWQPFIRIPYLENFTFFYQHTVNKYYKIFRYNAILFKYMLHIYSYIHAFIFNSDILWKVCGPQYLKKLTDMYWVEILKNKKNWKGYLNGFLILNAHSVYHELDRINQPTLIVSGLWDIITPAYLSFQMARKMKNVRHRLDFISSHFTIFEHPETVICEVKQFLEERKNIC